MFNCVFFSFFSFLDAQVLTNAKRQARFRAKRNADAERKAAYLQKEKQRYKACLETGKKKLIADMTPREQRKQRKEWLIPNDQDTTAPKRLKKLPLLLYSLHHQLLRECLVRNCLLCKRKQTKMLFYERTACRTPSSTECINPVKKYSLP